MQIRFWLQCLPVLGMCLLAPLSALGAQAGLAAAQLTADPVPAAEIPDNIAPEDVDALLAGFTDAQARRVLAEELHNRALATQRARQSAHGGFGVALVKFRKKLEDFTMDIRGYSETLRDGWLQLPQVLSKATQKLSGPSGLGVQLRGLVLFLVVGFAAHWGTRRSMRVLRERMEDAPSGSFMARASRSLVRGLSELVPILAFAIATLGLAAVSYDQDSSTRSFVIAYLSGALILLVTYVASRFVLAPYAPSLRLAPLGDGAAIFLHRWLMSLTVVSTILWLTAGLVILTGVPLSVHLILVLLTGAAMLVMLIAMIWSCRRAVAAAIAGGNTSTAGAGEPLLAQFASVWHWIAIIYITIVYLLWSLSMLARSPSAVWAAIGSVLLILAIVLADRAHTRLLNAFLGAPLGEAAPESREENALSMEAQPEVETIERLSEQGQARAAALERRVHYHQIGQTGGRVLLGAFAFVALCQLWGFNILAVAGAGAEAAFWDAVVEVGITLTIAYLVWQLARSLIDPHLPDSEPMVADEEHSAPMTRVETLLPLLRTCVLVVLVVLTTMLCLSAAGVDIGPLLAGAGVVGLAIGFGAQTLVKDIVSGIFFLIDDAFRVGEYIEFDQLRGEVEAISLRSLKLRHHRGAIHTVPFGELRSITNYNRDWVIYKMEFRLPIDTDVEKVRKIIKKLGQELMDDPEHGPNMLQPLKSQGISRLEENAIILRAKFMCKPREQFVLRRVAFQRIQSTFAENGISFAPRTINVAGAADPGHGAAAALAAEEAAERRSGT